MRFNKIFQRFLIPHSLTTLLYWIKYRCFISMRAEIEWTANLNIGVNTQISSFCKIKASDGPVCIGSNVSIGTGSFIASGEREIKIGDYCLISPNVTIVSVNYRHDRIDIPIVHQGKTSKGISIGDNVWIGAGATILDGTQIGNGVIITPNTVVSSHVPENAIVSGNPAKVIFMRR